jgi:hypothetical protein
MARPSWASRWCVRPSVLRRSCPKLVSQLLCVRSANASPGERTAALEAEDGPPPKSATWWRADGGTHGVEGGIQPTEQNA